MEIPERDWKHLRTIQPDALARYCERILAEATTLIGDETRSPHERYLDLSQLLRDHNRSMAGAFDDMRRSRAIDRLAAMISLHVLTDAELAQFSPDVRASAVGVNSVLSDAAGDVSE